MKPTNGGPVLALISAFLFGISPALAKLAVGEMSPALLAGLLYLGSGLGLQIILWIKKKSSKEELHRLSRRQWLRLVTSIFFGGILAPLCLSYGIKYGSVIEVSLLLNFETVATTVLAAWLFHEHVSARVWFGKGLIVLGAILLTTHSINHFALSLPALAMILACLFWGMDNNLTRDVEQLSPTVLASVKGLSAGAVNISLAYLSGYGSPHATQVFAILSIGAMSYGVSLVFFVQALRLIGTSRTSTYFASGPFFGMLLAIPLFGEIPNLSQGLATTLMLTGLFFLLRETHDHHHTHEPITHLHPHTHDQHHRHTHTTYAEQEFHEHLHSHDAITHNHWHLPDIHHRHRH